MEEEPAEGFAQDDTGQAASSTFAMPALNRNLQQLCDPEEEDYRSHAPVC